MEKFSTRLKRLMEEKGIKQAELSKRASISQSAVSKYINNLGEPKSRELHAISKALGVSMDSWFTGVPSTGEDGEDGKWKTRATTAEKRLRRLHAAFLKDLEEFEKKK